MNKTFEEQKFDREGKANIRFAKTQKRLRLVARDFINGQMTESELSDEFGQKDVTKLALHIFIYNDLKARRVPKA